MSKVSKIILKLKFRNTSILKVQDVILLKEEINHLSNTFAFLTLHEMLNVPGTVLGKRSKKMNQMASLCPRKEVHVNSY